MDRPCPPPMAVTFGPRARMTRFSICSDTFDSCGTSREMKRFTSLRMDTSMHAAPDRASRKPHSARMA